jgi:3-carboxy-cis,cis-muconate cycloisomerase
MPQKRNPMICEAIEAVARLVRTQAVAAIDAMHHEHERDWASFQMEWSYLPEVCVMAHGALKLTIRVMSGLKVYPERMLQNLELSLGSILAERVMLELGKFIGRQPAHDVIYQIAMKSFEERRSFAELLKESNLVSNHLNAELIDNLLDPTQYTGLAALYVDRVVGAN